MPTLLRNEVLGPLGLKATANSDTPAIPQPALHAFSSERPQFLKIPAGIPFYEESTYWNPSWTITHGAIQTTNIHGLEATAVGIGSGKLLSPDSYKKMGRPSCAAKHTRNRTASRHASSKTTATPTGSGSSYPAIG